MLEERTNEAFELGEQLTVVGKKLTPGTPAPSFALDTLQDGLIKQMGLAEAAGKVCLLNVVNSVDTPVCHKETQHWETLRATLPSNVVVYTISADLPFALARWAASENVLHAMLSSYRTPSFGTDYGVFIKEWSLLQRAVFVIDRQGQVVYAEYVPDQMAEPDYTAAVASAAKAAA